VAVPDEAHLTAALNTAAPGDTVDFQVPAGSTFNLTTQNPAASGSFYVINKNLTIDASALSGGVILNRAANDFRFFEVTSGVTVTLKNLTFNNGDGATAGGALLVTSGSTTVDGCTFTGNSTQGGGGAVESEPGTQLTVTRSSFSGNAAGTNGGAIDANGMLTANFNRLVGNTVPVLRTEVQTVTLTGAAMTGNFTLSGLGTTTTVTVGDSAGTVQTNLQNALTANNPSLANSILVTGTTSVSGGGYTITFTGPLGDANVDQFVATAGTLAGGTVTTGTFQQGFGNEVQSLTFAGTTGGTFTVSYGGPTSAPQTFTTTTATTLQTAIQSLVGGSNAVVAGSNAAGYRVFYSGALVQTDVAQLQVQGAGLTPPNSALTATIASGGGQGNEIFAAGAANVEDNWWGVNTGPGINDVIGAAPADWLTLINTASPSPIFVGQSTTYTASISGLHSGGTTAPSNLTGLPSFPNPAGTVFGNPVKGTLSGTSTQFVNGFATTTFTATSGGTGSVDATADSQTVTGTVQILLSLVVDENTDVNDGNFTPGHLSLREAVALTNANPGPDLITIAGSLANLTLNMTGGQYAITDSVTINGPAGGPYILNAGGASRIFQIDDGSAGTLKDVILSNLTLTNGSATNGGAILNHENLTFHNCTLSNNNATAGPGGAINQTGGSLSIDHTIISGNNASGDGGGMNISVGTFTLGPGDQVINNTSTHGDGGGINIAGGTAHQFNGTVANPIIISGNKALNANPGAVPGKGHGGGINLATTFTDTITIQGTHFDASAGTGNQAIFGGGISAQGGSLTLGAAANVVQGNTATALGGGIDFASTFATPFSAGAGLLLVTDNQQTTASAGITGGGGIAYRGTSTIGLTQNQIARNSTTGTTGAGGGLLITGGSVTLTSMIIGGATAANTTDGNSSTNGGGIAVIGGTLNLTGTVALPSVVRFNSTTGLGGGIFFSAGTGHQITNTTIASNQSTTASGNGGGLAVFNASGSSATPTGVTLTGVTIGGSVGSGNSSSNAGGGVIVDGFSGVTFVGANAISFNSAVTAGGGLELTTGFFGSMTVDTHLSITNNTVTAATGHGGGVSNESNPNAAGAVGLLTVSGATLNGNRATGASGSGGAIFSNTQGSGETDLVNATIGAAGAANGAASGGGVHVAGGRFSMDANTAVNFNTASVSGGGVFVSGGSSVTLRGTISDNQATGAASVGGGLAVDNAPALSIPALTVQNNTAVGFGGGIAFLSTYTAIITLDNSVAISSNQVTDANGAGGGISFAGTGTLTLSDLSLLNNQATGTNGIGGGLFQDNGAVNANGTTTIGATGTPNTAPFGGGVAVAGGTFTLASPALISFNTATTGGGLFVSAGAANILGTVSNNAASGGGGAAITGGTLHFTGATISNNQATGAAGTGTGGGIDQTGGATLCDPATITGNTATGDGGGVNVTAGTFTLSAGGQVANNTSTGGNGGGIAFSGTALDLTNGGSGGVSVTGNKANNTDAIPDKGNGGGLAIGGGTVTMDNATIGAAGAGNDNQALDGGGIAFLGGSPTLTFQTTASRVQFNTASVEGGGIASVGGTPTLNLDIATSVASNSAPNGGGIGFVGGAPTLNFNSVLTVQSNTATTFGGGIDLASTFASPITLADVSVLANTVSAGNGGGIAVRGSGGLTLSGATVSANQTTANGSLGGGVFESSGTLTITNSLIGRDIANSVSATNDGNTAKGAGGGVYVAGGMFSSTGSTFRENKADTTDGGGISFAAAATDVSISAATFATNFAGRNGGGIEIAATFAPRTLTLGGITITGNTAIGNGGGINVDAGTLTLSASAIQNNSAAGGGGIRFNGAALNLTSTAVTGNTALSGAGGGIAITAGTNQITSSSITNNLANTAAGQTGGGIDQSGAATTIDQTTISGNTSSGAGGGISVADGTLDLDNDTIAGNLADSGGGVSVTGNSTGTLTSTTVAANSASTIAGGILQSGGSLTVQNTLAGDNNSPGPGADLSVGGGTLVDQGNNLFESFTGFVPAPTDITGRTPLLAALANYGGSTTTMALLPGSPAIDAGTGAGADQRGVPVVGSAKDIGSFESGGFRFGATAGTSQLTQPNAAFADPLTVQVVANVPTEPVDGGEVVFTAPATGASLAPPVITGLIAGGVASSGTVTANANQGIYAVDLSSGGAPPLAGAYLLTNYSPPVLGPLGITTSPAGAPYASSIPIVNGFPPFSNFSATGLPPGLTATLNGNAISIAGTPATGGVFSKIRVSITDSLGSVASDTFSLTISPVLLTAVGTGAGVPAEVKVYNADGTVRFDLHPFDTFAGGVTVATGDVTGDGVADVVIGAGPTGAPRVVCVDGLSGKTIASFYAYAAQFSGGVFVAVGDADRDGDADIITGAGAGGGPHVKVFDGQSLAEIRSFLAFDTGFRGGVTVGFDDSLAQIVVGAGAGGAPHVKAFDAGTLAVTRSFFAFDPSFQGGVNVAAADGSIAVGTGAGAGQVNLFNPDGTVATAFSPYGTSFFGGVRVGFGGSAANPTLLTGAGPTGGPRVREFAADHSAVTDFFAFDESFTGGVYLG
jgi:hypothetical protein